MQEPPATPVARDELALRRHRFFSELLQAAQNSTEHRVRFDPLGPRVHTGQGLAYKFIIALRSFPCHVADSGARSNRDYFVARVTDDRDLRVDCVSR